MSSVCRCHVIDGDGTAEGPELTRVGGKHDAAYLERLIADPTSVNPKAEMSAFGSRLTEAELKDLAAYLASRK